jgi:hypothetical protein
MIVMAATVADERCHDLAQRCRRVSKEGLTPFI